MPHLSALRQLFPSGRRGRPRLEVSEDGDFLRPVTYSVVDACAMGCGSVRRVRLMDGTVRCCRCAGVGVSMLAGVPGLVWEGAPLGSLESQPQSSCRVQSRI